MTALAVCSFGTSAFAQSYTVEMQVVTKTDNQSKDETAKLALKSGSKFRVEQFTKLFNRIVIVNGGDSWSFDPASKTGMHARQDAKAVARLDAQGSSGLKIYAAFLKSGRATAFAS